ncbi:hypothetical protein FA15DRAFT_347546 [Coprinopsis marcescibilis]|uniref:Uncharacterized protein n=1 Tax=Coprinopsis marcescibilis TaxID=230819 RepID=A0A5C3L915_COPMA|nr:hypothetical protein FA15DRAFT_347546 [Coprinopsis marcescibilis]
MRSGRESTTLTPNYWNYSRKGWSHSSSSDQKVLKIKPDGCRAAFLREATRFKATRDRVDDPQRDSEVIQGAVDNALGVHLPQTIANAVFTAIVESSVVFELCVFDSFQP